MSSVIPRAALLTYLVAASVAGFSRAEKPVREKTKVACVGDSITQGTGISDPVQNGYPAQLERLLGENWEVRNFGRAGATLLAKSSLPYSRTPQCEEALAFEPDIVIIHLGANDTKPENLRNVQDFQGDYRALIESFRGLESRPDVWICYPVPVFQDRWGISNAPIESLFMPAIDDVALQTGVRIIDLHGPLRGRPELFPDHLHPNVDGAGVIAQIVAEHLRQTPAAVPGN